jgi:hypothetical protein
MEVTREQLAKALDHLWVYAKNREGTHHAQICQVTGDSMDSLWESLEEAARERDPWVTATTSRSALPHWTEITRDELTAFLARLRVGIEQQEDWKMGPTAMLSRPEAVADAIASHSHGLRLNEAAEQGDVVDAHIHCEHAPGSRAASELEAADKIVALLGPHRYDGARYVKRVLRWAWDYLTDGDEPPF